MAEETVRDSFIVRVYRVDTEDCSKITGIVEAIDGADRREPFRGVEELSRLLNAGGNPSEKKQKEFSIKR